MKNLSSPIWLLSESISSAAISDTNETVADMKSVVKSKGRGSYTHFTPGQQAERTLSQH